MNAIKSKEIFDQFKKGKLDKPAALHSVQSVRLISLEGIQRAGSHYQVVYKDRVIETYDEVESALLKAQELNRGEYQNDLERQRNLFMCHTYALAKQFESVFIRSGNTVPLPMEIIEAKRALDRHGWGGQ